MFASKKAYCFMFANQFYQLHLETIRLLINVLKVNYIDEPYKIMGLKNNIREDIKSERFYRFTLILQKYLNINLELMND